jgi:hypothetical protein
MTLSISQLEQLIEVYAEQVVDSWDMETLVQFAYDTIVERMENLLEHEVLDEIQTYYEPQDFAMMLEHVGVDPDTVI